MRSRREILAAVLLVALVVAASVAYFGSITPGARGSSPTSNLAPNFTVPDIYGQNFTLSAYRGSSVVVIEFTSLSCSECQIIEKSLASLYATYNSSGHSDVVIISIFTNPQFGDTIPALRSYHAAHNITWWMAQDTSNDAISGAYAVQDIPTVVVVNKLGQPIYNTAGVQTTAQIQSAISSALTGTAAPVSIVRASVFVLAAVAGITTFFSPCAFPMFPGYMSLFLGLNAAGPGPKEDATASASSSAGGPTYRGAARRALLAGAVTALGMIIVFLVIGLALAFASNFVGPYIPYLLLVVGSLLIVLGALLLTNLQYWRIVEPLQALGRRISGKPRDPVAVAAPSATERGLHLRLFSYGMGYAAAAAGCVAPVIFSAIIAGLALGFLGGIINILIFTLTAAALMIGVTLILALAGKKYVNLLKAYTPIIKKISASVLIVVGIYLVYFYYTAWGF